ncbi:hypothetical protein LJC56_03060 [Christensenellaceae bacterium OttesenSCG-928-K19]|nr:hypothetical protein [Christensenellaceae bacterium OttesenSCG-928-K19]
MLIYFPLDNVMVIGYIVSMESKNTEKPRGCTNEELHALLGRMHELQTELERVSAKPFAPAYSHTELHVLQAAANLPSPNVTSIAKEIGITRGAASKIGKRLLLSGDLKEYRMSQNKKELYFSLTEKGRVVNAEHESGHTACRAKDLALFDSMTEDEKQTIAAFLARMNGHIDGKIKEYERKQEV